MIGHPRHKTIQPSRLLQVASKSRRTEERFAQDQKHIGPRRRVVALYYAICPMNPHRRGRGWAEGDGDLSVVVRHRAPDWLLFVVKRFSNIASRRMRSMPFAAPYDSVIVPLVSIGSCSAYSARTAGSSAVTLPRSRLRLISPLEYRPSRASSRAIVAYNSTGGCKEAPLKTTSTQ